MSASAMTRACCKCHVLESASTPLTWHGAVLCCARCAATLATTPCAPGQHDWRGHATGNGQWVCHTCTSVMPSMAIAAGSA